MHRDHKINPGYFWALICFIYMPPVLLVEFLGVPVSDTHSLGMLGLHAGVVGFCMSGLLAVMSSNRWVFAVCFPVILIISSVMCFYELTIGTRLTPVAIEIAMVNNFTMWWSMISPGLIVVIILSLVIAGYLVWFRFNRVDSDRRQELYLALGGIIVVLIPTVFVRRFKAPVGARLPYSIYYSFAEYFENRRAILEERDTFTDEVPKKLTDSIPDVIVVLGESLRADHLPFSGYERNTLPRLSGMTNVINVPNLWTDFTYTEVSVPYIMTRGGRGLDGAFEEQSFITLFKNAGYQTSWFANQDLGTSYTYFAHEADSLIYVNAGKSFYSYDKWLDRDILEPFGRWINQADGRPKLAVVHTIGSHWWYRSHYLEEHALFKPEITHKDVGGLSREQMINSYDNTIIATDEFLSELYETVKERNAIIFYISDHGEGLGEDGKYLHAEDLLPLHFPACMVIYSPRYASNFPEKIELLRANSTRHENTGITFHTVLDLASLETPSLNPQKSLLR